MGVKELRESLKLEPHPEGGFFAETFRDKSVSIQSSALPSRFKVGRSVSTAIYFLLPSGSTSKLHRIPSYEVFHFYDGDPATVRFLLSSSVLEMTARSRAFLGSGKMLGGSLVCEVVEIDETGHIKYTVLGKDLAAGQVPQYVVPPYIWFGVFPTLDFSVSGNEEAIQALPKRDSEEHYSLLGCTVAPAFQFEDFDMGERSALLALYPNARAPIEILTDPE